MTFYWELVLEIFVQCHIFWRLLFSARSHELQKVLGRKLFASPGFSTGVARHIFHVFLVGLNVSHTAQSSQILNSNISLVSLFSLLLWAWGVELNS